MIFMKEMIVILTILVLVLAAFVCVLVSKVDVLETKMDSHTGALGGLRERADALERRDDWLGSEIENGLSREHLIAQRAGTRLMNAVKRLKRVESCLGLNPKDAFEEAGDGQAD
jgi:predicted Holliday junction resolvase-like endonuclease